ncbi:quinolinate synthase NadA [Desulforhabdus amnigena]|uniref:Quinolinate synthase n=1 Tax=Desulforhabdus amnigena TaxID=40218 RepID=A0A9W6D200_9BACT|nr:quinolinate synthase NadA [Desulforhabdus amnigena]NLJ27347.1 quinolinate synthase NadA [Deltaproteobacteria bacterium]GLI34702.1 quinolinate synthase A [Desulforhabdus amnigena]
MNKEEIVKRILQLKREKNAIILAHNYQPPVIQDIADMTGDSLELSRQAASTAAEVIVFCGVAFMAETAAILNPGKTVLLPRLDAGCPMADMITPEDVRTVRAKYPGIPIVTYVNSTAAVKAESTVCCTSANSIHVVESFKDHDTVYMAPDQNLAKYTARHTKKQVMHWNGYCPIHHHLKMDAVKKKKQEHPEALFLAHPECPPEILDLADMIQSTSGMLRFVRESTHEAFIIGTEEGILHPMRKQNPDKRFYSASGSLICPDMKKTSLEDVLRSLETLQPRITVPEDIRVRALGAVERMLTLG